MAEAEPTERDSVGDDGERGEDIFIDVTIEENRELFSLNQELENILDIKNTLSTPPPLIDISPFECAALQQDEIEALRAIFDSDITSLNDSCSCFYVSIRYLAQDIREEDIIKIWFSLPPNYPSVPPILEIESNQSGTFTYADSDELYDILTQAALSRVGGMMVYDLIILAQEHMPLLVKRKEVEKERQREVDEERRKRIDLEDALRHPKKDYLPSHLWPNISGTDLDEERDNGDQEDDSDEETPIKYQTRAVYHPRGFIGTISAIIAKLPPFLQITRIENIIRQDLAARFKSCHDKMVGSLWRKERSNPHLYCLAPQIAFHGTQTKSLPSIVQHGLVIPGQNNTLKVRCGASLGRGIYLSPNAEFSLGYTDSNRLIVCAALLGKVVREFGSRKVSDYFTYVSDSEYEWVFFNAAQVLPCYVIQVSGCRGHDYSYGAPIKPNQSSYGPVPHKVTRPPLSSLLDDGHEDNVDQNEIQKREKLLTRARKYLPFGFGPGEKTVILEAGEIDDDEEDYGDYQLLRHQQSDKDYSEVPKEESELQAYRFEKILNAPT